MNPIQTQLNDFCPEILTEVPAIVELADLQLALIGGGTGEVII